MLRYIWPSPATSIGLGLAFLASVSGGNVSWRNGLVEAHGGILVWLLRGGRYSSGGAAMTWGHVILARDAACLAQSRAHEMVHVRQFERWGPLLIPVYFLIARYLAWRGFDPHLDHPFEQDAYDRR